jgi:uncharacterized protein YecE (DUF72 family)
VKLSPRTIVGTAGWSIPRASAHRCAGDGSHLERYARVFGGAEINSSFYRPHSPATYARWAASAPDAFRFAVKVPRLITHDRALRRARDPLRQFLDETSGLGGKRGPLLVQLPPSHAFDARVAGRFFDLMRRLHEGPVACEPRHATWFTPRVDRLFEGLRISRVAADPARVPPAAEPGGWPGLAYYRLHGSPRTYWSRYDRAFITGLGLALRARPAEGEAWCMFDNTASGAALENAFELQRELRE